MATTMVPDVTTRPSVFPTERLLENGMARPHLRQGLRRISNLRNAITVASVWFWVAVLIGGAVWLGNPLGYLAAFILMGPMYARFAILMHEAAHKLLFTNKRANDWVGTWLIAYPTWTPISSTGAATSPITRRSSGPPSRTSPSTAAIAATDARWPDAWFATRSASPVGRTSSPCSKP